MSQEDQRGPSDATGTAALQAGWYHGHRDVSGGWLRPAVFGAVDGLVTNASLISGLGGGGVPAHTVVLTGVAALVAGAFSMGTGEYVSVTNQNELVHAEVALEQKMHALFPVAEQEELAGYFREYGADPETADRMAAAARDRIGVRYSEQALRAALAAAYRGGCGPGLANQDDAGGRPDLLPAGDGEHLRLNV